MKQQFCFLLFAFCFEILASCTNKKDKTPTYGDLNFEAVAADTTMQNNIEASDEYTKDYNFGNVQYSIAWGGFTGFENVLVTERKSINELDTIAIVKTDSNYRLTNSFIKAENRQKMPEFLLVFTRKTDSTEKKKTVLFSNGKWQVK